MAQSVDLTRATRERMAFETNVSIDLTYATRDRWALEAAAGEDHAVMFDGLALSLVDARAGAIRSVASDVLSLALGEGRAAAVLVVAHLLSCADRVKVAEMCRAIGACSGGYFERPSGSCPGGYEDDDDQCSNLYQELV